MATLYRGGVVHSAAAPFAAALVVAGDRVVWLGDDDTAPTVRDDVDEVVDLDGALVTPAFVDAHVTDDPEVRDPAEALGEAARRGVAAVHVVGARPGGPASAGRAARGPDATPLPHVARWVRVARAADVPDDRGPDDGAGPGGLVVGVHLPAAHVGHLADVVRAARSAGLRVSVDVPDEVTLAAVRDALSGLGPAGDVRLEHLTVPGAGDRVPPGAGTVACPGLWGTAAPPLARLAAAGVPLALGSGRVPGQDDPWAAVRAAVHHPDPAQGVSARAAFRAHTRGGWRLAGLDGGGAGEIRVGGPATLAIWRTGPLAVQAADDRVSAWSTDPRAGTPLLPELSPEGALPTCVRTLRDGQLLHDALG